MPCDYLAVANKFEICIFGLSARCLLARETLRANHRFGSVVWLCGARITSRNNDALVQDHGFYNQEDGSRMGASVGTMNLQILMRE